MATFVVYGCKSANQKCSALVTAADEAGAIAAANAIGANTNYGAHSVVQVSGSDMSTPDVAFYGDAIGQRDNGVWPDRDRAA